MSFSLGLGLNGGPLGRLLVWNQILAPASLFTLASASVPPSRLLPTSAPASTLTPTPTPTLTAVPTIILALTPSSIPVSGYFVLVNVSQNKEEVYLDGHLLEENLVSTGAPSRFGPGAGTPLGRWRIAKKVTTNPSGEYGPFYLALEKETKSGFVLTDIGMHGTNEPGLIGQDASHGCIRHDNDTIRKLADILPIGTIVETVD